MYNEYLKRKLNRKHSWYFDCCQGSKDLMGLCSERYGTEGRPRSSSYKLPTISITCWLFCIPLTFRAYFTSLTQFTAVHLSALILNMSCTGWTSPVFSIPPHSFILLHPCVHYSQPFCIFYSVIFMNSHISKNKHCILLLNKKFPK